MAFVFSRVVTFATGDDFGAYVIGGIMAWSYFAATLANATSAIVDASGLTDKVWFPRVILVLVPPLANGIGLVVSLAVLIALLPLLGVGLGARLALLVPAMALLISFTTALSLVLSALYVYFRDVRFIVQASLLVWLYVTPIVYYQDQFDDHGLLDFNPMTGVVEVFRLATVGGDGDWIRAVTVTAVATAILAVVGFEAHRRHDRLFVDQL
jgi:ABC-type polysaccharide/polyol phosphate export permease